MIMFFWILAGGVNLFSAGISIGINIGEGPHIGALVSDWQFLFSSIFGVGFTAVAMGKSATMAREAA